jgi:hypothetical protein
MESSNNAPNAIDKSSLQTLPEGRFAGRDEFAELIRHALQVAAGAGWREMIWCDADFDDWPLGERAVIDSLQAWSHSGRKLTVLAQRYDGIVRRHARFVTWRQHYSHLVECRASARGPADALPSALWSPGWAFERLDQTHSSGFSGSEPGRRVGLREKLGERLLKSTPAFAATTLGL